MSNAMRFGKRSLAGLASGALLLSGIALVVAQPAQAVASASVFCSGGTAITVPGTGGTANDPTTVRGSCSVPAGAPTNAGTLSPSNNVLAGATWLWINVSGTAGIGEAATNSLGTLGTDWARIDAQTIVVAPNFSANAVAVAAGSSAPGNTTVTVRVSTQPGIAPGTVSAGNTVADSTFTVAFYGTPVSVAITESLAAIPPQFNNTGGAGPTANQITIATVSARDAAGNVYPLNAGNSATPTTVELFNAPSANRDTLAITGISGNRFSVAVQSNGSTLTNGVRPVGTNEYTVRLTPTLPDLRDSSSYVVSNTLGGSYTLSFDKAEYQRGESATMTMCVNDLGGRIVPDGLTWEQLIYNDDTNGVERNASFFFNAAISLPNGTPKDSIDNQSIATAAGCTTWTFFVPDANVDLTVTPSLDKANATGYSPGWASVVTGPTSATVKVGTGGGEPPTPATIFIVGQRGKGDNIGRVFVEGTTSGFGLGGEVTPYFRFPGETGMTAGTGAREVDAEGNFQWQRKTGKQIAVQFRAGDVRSNTVIIEAK